MAKEMDYYDVLGIGPSATEAESKKSYYIKARQVHPDKIPNDPLAAQNFQDALEHLASIDLIELCNEAKTEHCRATRDLSSCGRDVQHVLISCGHASLCAECCQRCDVCPVCRTSIPTTGSRVRPRLYYKCIDAGLISKKQDDMFQEKDSRNYVMTEIRRLYSLFDVALENNLVSLICHYVSDVCMDETAVSSDPVLAFLLDEVVIKDWCKRTLENLISNLHELYGVGVEEMKSKLFLFQKFAIQLTGISSVLEIMVLSFKEAFAGQLHDLHQLLENTMKAKQHLEVMIWCIRHQFLEGVQSRFPNAASWKLHVLERKSEAVRQAWPDYSNNVGDSSGPNGTRLFIEQALSNLGMGQSYAKDRVDDVDISSLQDENSPSLFLPKIDEANTNGYPFKSLRIAADVLFLHGISDTVVAKQAILLYYLFDRHWSTPDVEWQYLIDDFSATFGINRHSVLESLVFFLLDDHSLEALQEASHLLPEISGSQTHPKIAQVLLERQCPDVALTVLKCTGRDDFFSTANIEHDDSQLPSLGEAVTAVRVRIECGLLTEAFIYHRVHCTRVKEEKSKHVALTNKKQSDSWIYHVEVLVTEICYLCMRRNLVDRMIELPWNSDEEKHLHKCLFDHACQSPAAIYGSLLVVFYLQRYRYSEAYQVDHTLQNLESSTLETATEDIASRIRLIAKWRQGLVAKCLQLLPEVQQQKVVSASETDDSYLPLHDLPVPLATNLSNESSSPALLTSSMSSLVGQQKKFSHSKKINDQAVFYSPSSNAGSAFGSKCAAVLQHRFLATLESPISRMNSVVPDGISSNNQNGEVTKLKNIFNVRDMQKQADLKQGLPSQSAPLKELHSSLRLTKEDTKIQSVRPDFSVYAENSHPFMPRVTSGGRNEGGSTPHNNGTIKQLIEETDVNFRSFENRDSRIKHQSAKGGLRWRSDESSEDEESYRFNGHNEDGVQFGSRRRARFSRR